jgi:hypothetical protein
MSCYKYGLTRVSICYLVVKVERAMLRSIAIPFIFDSRVRFLLSVFGFLNFVFFFVHVSQ